MSGGHVAFVGCGPGAADLLTLRAAEAIASADVVVWGRALLVEEAVRRHARPEAEVVAWPPATMDDVLAVYERAARDGLAVVRLKSGDPGLYGEMGHELDAVRRLGLQWTLVPGVSSLGAAAAALGRELGDTVIRRVRPAGDTEPTLALFMPGRDPAAVVERLREQGAADATPCAIVHRVSWPGELVVRCRLDELAGELEDLRLDGMTLVLAGAAVAPARET